MWYGVLFLIALVTFFASGAWWISGVNGGSRGEPGPIEFTIFITLCAAGIMFALGLIP